MQEEHAVDPVEHVGRELGLLLRSLKAMHPTVLAAAGLRVELPAVAVLSTLEHRGGIRLSTLAEALVLDLSSVSRQVAALEREGWVERARDPHDSRAALLDLTEAGRDALARVRAAQAHHLRQRLPDWTDHELEMFASSLSRFRLDLTSDPVRQKETA